MPTDHVDPSEPGKRFAQVIIGQITQCIRAQITSDDVRLFLPFYGRGLGGTVNLECFHFDGFFFGIRLLRHGGRCTKAKHSGKSAGETAK